MNNKEKELYRILDNVVSCCATQVDDDGTMSVTREIVLGKSRAENAVMTRCILVYQIVTAANANIDVLKAQVAALSGVTKVYIPSNNVCQTNCGCGCTCNQ